MQVNVQSQDVNLNSISKSSSNKSYKPIYLLTILVSISMILFLILGVNKENISYAMSQRVPKLVAIALTAGTIAFSTVVFQTITNNRILTPSVLGLDSLYELIQTVIFFTLGASSLLITNKKLNFIICVGFMVLSSFALYKVLFKSKGANILFLLLVGMIFGTLFSSLSSFMQMIIDPNEFLVLQNKLFASFNNVNVDILLIAILMILIVIPFIYDDIKYLDVISLGRDHAINLGINYDKVVKKFLVVISIFLSISTALVGPVTFLGLLVVNITRQVMKTYKHNILICTSVLISLFTLVSGQLLIERILKINTPVSVIINLIGGVYFMYLLLKESKI